MLGEFSGNDGSVTYVDEEPKRGRSYKYYIIPVHPQMEIDGQLMTGTASQKIEVKIP